MSIEENNNARRKANGTIAPQPTVVSELKGKTQSVNPFSWDLTYDYIFYVGVAKPDGSIDSSKPVDGINSTTVEQLSSSNLFPVKGTTGTTQYPVSVTLNIPPQSLSISLQFASTVSATNRGVLEENNGIVFRNISISGTTGILPQRETRDAPSKPDKYSIKNIGQLFFPAASAGISKFIKSGSKILGSTPPGEAKNLEEAALKKTGYYQFWLLNNFFIEYAEAKKKTGNSDLRLIFYCPKDNMRYICTPQVFDLRKDSSQPNLYRYSIGLKSWDLATDKGNSLPTNKGDEPFRSNRTSIKKLLNTIRKARNTIQQASGVIKGVQSDIFSVMNVVNQAVLALKDIVGVGVTIMDFKATLKSNANLLVVTNKNQWAQLLNKNKIGLSRASIEAHKAIASFQSNLNTGINPTAGSSTSGAITSAKSSSSSKSNAGPSGETVSGDSVNNASAVKAISPLLDIPELADTIQLRELGPLPASVQAQITKDQNSSVELNAGQVRGLAAKLGEVSDNLAYASGSMDPEYAKTFSISQPIASNKSPTEDDIILSASIEEARDALLSTLSTGDLFQERPTDPFITASTIISPDETIITPTSAYAVVVNRGDTLERMAQVYLGDAIFARDIALLNNLRAPYIDEVGFTLPVTQAANRTFLVKNRSQLTLNQIVRIGGTLVSETRRKILNIEDVGNNTFRVTVNGKPDLDKYSSIASPYIKARIPGTVGSGDNILIPSEQEADQIADSRDTPLQDRMSFAEKVFRVDIALSDTGDLDISSSGDVARSYGYNNAVQALRLLLETEKGELEWHLTYGFDASVGQKIQDFGELISFRVRTAIVSDPRFTNANVDVTLVGTAYIVKVEAFGAQGTGRIPLEFSLPV